MPYRITDQLFLWLLTDPGDPVVIGTLNLVRSMRGVSLRYADSWIERGFALSEDLPLVAEELFPTAKDTAVGAVDDARPDRWGERVIKSLDKPPRLSLLEYLYFAGDDRFGALGVSTSNEAYQPRRTGPLPKLADTAAIQALVRSRAVEKNHVLLVNDAQTYELSPAFDVLPSGQALGYQQMRVGSEHADSTLVNAMSMCRSFGLQNDEAAREVRLVIGVIDRWKQHFRSCGVSARDIELLAEQIDRPFLEQQRRDF